jgi:hypothetical protein
MKRLLIYCVALCLLLGACGPTFLGENDPEYGAPKGGHLDNALACAVDIALAGGDVLSRGTDSLPNEVKGGQAAQASLHKLLDDRTNSWQGREAFYSLTAGPGFTWRGQYVRSVYLRMQSADGMKEWSGLAVRDSQNVWFFVDRVQRWSSADTLAFYKGVDRPGDGQNNSWSGGAGPCSLTVRNTDIKGNIIVREFSLQVGGVTVEGSVSRQEKRAWRLEDAR